MDDIELISARQPGEGEKGGMKKDEGRNRGRRKGGIPMEKQDLGKSM